MKFFGATKIIAAGTVCMLAMPAFPQIVQVEGAWVRATVTGQKSTGAFMRIKAESATRLVGVSSPVAGVAEVHEMKMNGDVMTMREVPVLDLPAGKMVDFKSGGYHLMLMDLNRPLLAGGTIALTLKFRNAAGVESRQEVMAPVSKSAPGAAQKAAAEKH